MIIVEGPDGAGKTTLARALATELGLQVADKGNREVSGVGAPPKHEVRDKTYTALSASVGGKEPVRIYDRLFFSEVVYGPLFRSSCQFSGYEIRYVKKVLAAMECPVIFCLPPMAVLRDNVNHMPQMSGVPMKIKQLREDYKTEYQDATANGINAHWYDYTDGEPSFDWIVTEINAYMHRRRQRSC